MEKCYEARVSRDPRVRNTPSLVEAIHHSTSIRLWRTEAKSHSLVLFESPLPLYGALWYHKRHNSVGACTRPVRHAVLCNLDIWKPAGERTTTMAVAFLGRRESRKMSGGLARPSYLTNASSPLALILVETN